MTTILQIADSVTAQLNATQFDQEFVAERLYVPNFDLEDMKELRVSVVPRDVEILQHDRSQNRYHCRVDIAIQKKFSHGTNQEIDALVDLGEKIADEFRLKRLLSFQAARCIKVEQTVLYSTEHWEQLRQFTSLMTLTFELSR
jgi:hypothetical protein